jgi:hypothetical protein
MQFDLNKSLEILEKTPIVLETMLAGLSDEWINNNEGPGTWSPYDIIGHLIHGEKTDWISRMEIILSDNTEKTFKSFDRFAQFKASKGKTLKQLLDEFKELRNHNIQQLLSKDITEDNLKQKGIHPAFGQITLQQLLSTWVVHDLNHIAQIARVMAKQYKIEVGPWREYLKIINL